MEDADTHFEFCGVCTARKTNMSSNVPADRYSRTVRKEFKRSATVFPGRFPVTEVNEKEFSKLTSPKSGDTGESNKPRTAVEKDSMGNLRSTAEYNKSREIMIFLKKSLEEVKRKKEGQDKQFADDLSSFQHLKRQGLPHDKEQAKLIAFGKRISSTKQEMDHIKKQLESANQEIVKTRQLTGEMARFITNSSPTSNRTSPGASPSPKAS